MMVRWRTYSFKVDGEQREQESLDGEEDREKDKTTRRRRNIPRYGGEGEEAETCDDARVRRTRCSDADRDLEGRRRLEEEESVKA